MSDLQDLYQQMILDHYRSPRNCRQIEESSCSANGHNPLCGDKVAVYVNVENGAITDVSFEGSGCAISTASASLMTEAVKGKSLDEAHAVFKTFHQLIAGDEAPDADLGKLEIFAGVRQYPTRVKCATLAWHTLEAALKEDGSEISTE